MENRRERGVIKWYNRSKGFGFVTSTQTGQDVFIHASCIADKQAPLEYDEVTYEIGVQADGRSRAEALQGGSGGPTIARPVKKQNAIYAPPQIPKHSRTEIYSHPSNLDQDEYDRIKMQLIINRMEDMELRDDFDQLRHITRSPPDFSRHKFSRRSVPSPVSDYLYRQHHFKRGPSARYVSPPPSTEDMFSAPRRPRYHQQSRPEVQLLALRSTFESESKIVDQDATSCVDRASSIPEVAKLILDRASSIPEVAKLILDRASSIRRH